MGNQYSQSTFIVLNKANKENEHDRELLMDQLKIAQKDNSNLKEKLKLYQELDPDELEKLKSDSEVDNQIL